MNDIVPGVKFNYQGAVFVVVKPNPKILGDWFCESITCNTGLWSFDPRDIQSLKLTEGENCD